jgi:peptide/nickel transport system substrate-binding protein
MHVPWPLGRVDPHRLDDVAAACFGECLFDTLYARDEAGAVVASLAESDPELGRGGVRVRLRAGIRFASGALLDAAAVAESIERARSHDAAAWLLDVPTARADGDSVVFAGHDARRVARALASPLVAIVPPRFSPDRPDGTGPFRAQPTSTGLRLLRNPLGASGPALLDVIEVEHATDLATSLRAFESGADDVGWLGSFLHEPRTGARSFDGGTVGWAVLKTGRDAGILDSPGTAQALADGVRYAALAPLVVGPPWTQGEARWTGPPCDLLTRDDAPWLAEVARAMAAAMSAPSHEVTPRLAPAAEIAARRSSRAFALLVDAARPAGPGELGSLLGIAGADDPSTATRLARHPPRGATAARAMTRTMRTGVVGEIRLQGGRAPDLTLPPSPWGRGIDWGSASRG